MGGRILVTGGCGFIGSHTIVDLIDNGFEVVSIDNLVNSSERVLDGILAITGKRVKNYNVDLCNKKEALAVIKGEAPFDGIIHFAALKSVEESVHQPLRYLRNNIDSTLTVLEAMQEASIDKMIFSSSCTVYGIPDALPVTEITPIAEATNPYGATKQIGEIMSQQFAERTIQKQVISLRYFNPAGAHPSYLIGEAPSQVANNLVPVITETVYGLREKMTVFGNDYATRDGSCVRDFIHVMDLAGAHTLAIKHLLQSTSVKSYSVYNVGSGDGITVLEAIHAFEESTGLKVPYAIGPRRAGDVPAIYADFIKIKDDLGWTPKFSLLQIMQSAWEWEKLRRAAK